MMFRTHRIFVILLCLVIFLNPYGLFDIFSFLGTNQGIFSMNFIVFLIIAVFASMIPDIDNPSSKLGRNIKIFGYVFKHRGFFHSLPALLLFTWIFSRFISSTTTAAFFIGYFSHLLLDNLNYQGIYWLYPLRFRIKGFTRTKSLFEKLFFYVNVIAVLGLLLYGL